MTARPLLGSLIQRLEARDRGAVRCRVLRPAHRLRQRGEPAARAIGRAQAGRRAALGAGRVAARPATDYRSALLALAGGAAGLALAYGATRALAAAQISFLPRPDNITIDGRIVLFTLALSLVTGLVFGLMPACQATRRSLSNALRERGASSAAGGRRLRQALVVTEMALAVLLLSGAGLLVRSFINLSNVDPGFVVGNAVTFVLGLPDASYHEDAKRVAFLDRATDALKGAARV